MVIRRPLNVLKLPDKLGLQPPAFLHLLGGQALSPPPTFGLRKVHEGAIVQLEPPESSKQLFSRGRRKAIARSCHIDEIGATVVAKGQGVEVLGARCISCDHELLPPIEPHLLPCAGALTGFVWAVQSFCHQSFQSLSAHGINQVRETGIQFGRMANGLAQF